MFGGYIWPLVEFAFGVEPIVHGPAVLLAPCLVQLVGTVRNPIAIRHRGRGFANVDSFVGLFPGFRHIRGRAQSTCHGCVSSFRIRFSSCAIDCASLSYSTADEIHASAF